VAIGWAWDTSDPEGRVTVALEAEGEVVAEAVADIARDELVSAGIGDGAHGFEIALPDHLRSRAYVRVVLLVGPDLVRVPRSDSFWQEASPGNVWSSVTFVCGREGEPETEAEIPVEVPPPPEPPPLRAVVGHDGWLFDAAELESLANPSAGELDRLAGTVQALATSCAEVGVTYVPACVPNKLQAVPEGSPVRTVDERPWLTGLRARLRDTDGVEVLDLLPVLADARRHGPCFHRSDPDWNDLGAFFAARALIKEAAKRVSLLKPPSLAALYLTRQPGYRGQLADAPRVATDGDRPERSDFVAEERLEIDAAYLRAQRMPIERHLAGADVHVRLLAIDTTELSPRLSVVGDGTCLALLPWLAETVPRTTFFWALTPPMEPVELELPDAVLHLIRYRDLPRLAAVELDAS
jgi:hypothetical protein